MLGVPKTLHQLKKSLKNKTQWRFKAEYLNVELQNFRCSSWKPAAAP